MNNASVPQDENEEQYYGEYDDEADYVPPEYDEEMRATFPNRNTYDFENGIQITSEFESGNLWKCVEIKPEETEYDPEWYYDEEEEVKEEQAEDGEGKDPSKEIPQYDINDVETLFAPTENEQYCFDIKVCPDSLPYYKGSKQRAMFYFSVTGMPDQSKVETWRTLRFRVINQSNQGKLLSYGHKPFYLILSSDEFQELQKGNTVVQSQKWQRIPDDVHFRRKVNGVVMAFEFTLKPNFKKTDHILFAYAQPFTRTDIDKGVLQFESDLKRAFGEQLYYKKEVLTKSLEGHPIHYLTVSL